MINLLCIKYWAESYIIVCCSRSSHVILTRRLCSTNKTKKIKPKRIRCCYFTVNCIPIRIPACSSYICIIIIWKFIYSISSSSVIICIYYWLTSKFRIKKSAKNNDTITRTIRISGSTFDKITELADKNGISFNNLINQIIEYGLNHIDDKEEIKV